MPSISPGLKNRPSARAVLVIGVHREELARWLIQPVIECRDQGTRNTPGVDGESCLPWHRVSLFELTGLEPTARNSRCFPPKDLRPCLP